MNKLTVKLENETVTIFQPGPEDSLGQGLRFFGEERIIGLDVETTFFTDLSAFDKDFRIRLLQFGTKNKALVLNMELPNSRLFAIEVLQNPELIFCSHTNIDVLSVYNFLGVDITGRNIDTRMLAAMAAPDDRLGGNDLKSLASKHISSDLLNAQEELETKFRELKSLAFPDKRHTKASVQRYGWDHIDVYDDTYVKYAGLDAIVCRRLLDILISETHATTELLNMETWLSAQATRIQLRGMRLDIPKLEALSKEAKAATQNAEARILEATKLPARSPKLTSWLTSAGVSWEGLPVTAKGSPSLTRETVGKLKSQEVSQTAASVIADIEDFKNHQDALLKTDGILSHLTDSGRIHPRLNTLGAVTGRMSSSNPNFQNFSKEDSRLRGLFLPDKGKVLLTADFDQIELRVVAALAVEHKMIDAIHEGIDLHQLTADEIGVTRKMAKMINFLIVYGGGGKHLSDKADIPLEEAQRHVRTFRERYKSIDQFSRKLGQRREYVTSISHRRIPVGTVKKTGEKRTYANVNYVVQSSARDLLVHAWYKFAQRGRGHQVWFPLHDELICQASQHDVDATLKDMQECMTFDFMGVPITATAVPLYDENGVSRWMTADHAQLMKKVRRFAATSSKASTDIERNVS